MGDGQPQWAEAAAMAKRWAVVSAVDTVTAMGAF